MPPAGTGFKPRQAIEIWCGPEALTLHGVHARGDSLRGVPLWKPPECDTCQVAVPLQDIDSLRAVQTEGSWMVATVAIPLAVVAALAITWQLSGGPGGD